MKSVTEVIAKNITNMTGRVSEGEPCATKQLLDCVLLKCTSCVFEGLNVSPLSEAKDSQLTRRNLNTDREGANTTRSSA